MARVIVPLDVPSAADAMALVDRLGEPCSFYKVGLELYAHEGPAVVRALRERGKEVFLDLKLHDIPNTVAGAVTAAARQGVQFLTVHATGGRDMLEAAVAASREVGVVNGREAPTRLLAVTVLTSLSAVDLEHVWGRSLHSLREEVVRLASLAAEAGVDGVVSSVLEARAIKRSLGQSLTVVTPGIRLEGGEAHDQARVATPEAAVEAGSDYLVVGRAITAAPDPRAALLDVQRRIAS